MSETELEKLEKRVEAGIDWLTAHDPLGRFHLWYTARILPSTPMPAQDAASIAAYREYYAARALWERLWRSLVREEERVGRGAATRGGAVVEATT